MGGTISIEPEAKLYEVVLKEKIIIECKLKNIPIFKPYTIIWSRRCRNTEIYEQIREYTDESFDSSTSLEISSSDETDSGFYICSIRYRGTEIKSEEIELRVYGKIADEPEQNVNYGSTVVLKCRSIDEPQCVNLYENTLCLVTLEHNFPDLKIDEERNRIFIIPVDKFTKTIDYTNLEDVGIYRFMSWFKINGLVRIQVCDIQLRINDIRYTVNSGEHVEMECCCSNATSISSVVWTKMEKLLDPAKENYKYIGSTIHSPSLTILNTDEYDNGTYTCVVKGLNGETLHSITMELFVNGSLSVKVATTSYNVSINGSVNLKCSISGHPPPQFTYWIKVSDGKQEPVSPHSILPNYSPAEHNDIFLPIKDADDSHDGVYKCISVNNNSEIQSEEIQVSVLGGYRTVLETFKFSHSLVPIYEFQLFKCMPNASNLKKRKKCFTITDIYSLKAGMHVCFSRITYNHHGIVTNVMPTKNAYEVIHMTGGKDTISNKQVFGVADLKKEIKSFVSRDISHYYDYEEFSIDNIYRDIQIVQNESQEGSIVSKRACIFYEAYEQFRYDVYYKLFSFNCEHFASYCATGLAYCKQKDIVTLTSNVQATVLLDKQLTVYCEEKLGTKRPSDATFKTLQKSCLFVYKADVTALDALVLSLRQELDALILSSWQECLHNARFRRVNSIHELKEGTEIIILNNGIHNAIVTDICLGKQMFEAIHLTKVSEKDVDCEKILMKFQSGKYFMCDYGDVWKINVDGNTIKLRACILHKIFHTIKDLRYHPIEFNCDNFASYCVTGSAYNKRYHRHNEEATQTLDTKLIGYCSRFISLPE